jgi:hypothetical protein
MFDRELGYYGITPHKDRIGALRTFPSFAKANREYEIHLFLVECYNQFYQSINAVVGAFPRITSSPLIQSLLTLDSEERKLFD